MSSAKMAAILSGGGVKDIINQGVRVGAQLPETILICWLYYRIIHQIQFKCLIQLYRVY